MEIMKSLFVSVAMDFEIGRCRELLECHKVAYQKYFAVFVIPAVLPSVYVAIGWRTLYQKKTGYFLLPWNIFLSVQIRVGDQAN